MACVQVVEDRISQQQVDFLKDATHPFVATKKVATFLWEKGHRHFNSNKEIQELGGNKRRVFHFLNFINECAACCVV